MLIRTGRFVRADRLLQSQDFKRVLKSGERRSSRAFTLFLASRPPEWLPADNGRSKLGITVSKRVGNAVVRNRIKRQVREWFRCARGWLPGGKDIVVVARPAARELSGSSIAAMLDQLARRADVSAIGQMVVGSR